MTDVAAGIGALAALLALLSRSRTGLVAGLVGLALAEGALARDLVPGGITSRLSSPGTLVVLSLGAALVCGAAAILVRYPGAVPPLVLAAAPFRLPLEFGAENRLFVSLGDRGSLGRLLPLYAVVAAAGLALAWRALRGESFRALPSPLALPAGLLAALMIGSILWAYDPTAARDRVVFFVLPFVALLAIVARAPFRKWLPRVLAVEAVALAVVFAAVGLGEAWTRELIFYDPKVAVANSYTSYFRVTSLFSDPSIYGRHLVAAIAILLVAVWLGRIRLDLGAGLIGFVWAGLFFAYSQSSLLAVAAVAVVVTFLVGDRPARRTLAVAGTVVALLGGTVFLVLARGESVERVTSDRSTLVADTATVVGNHPLLGVGVAGQPAATRDEVSGAGSARRRTSHTAPLTVAAELGLVGLALYVAFLLAALRLLAAVRRTEPALGLGLLAVLVGIFVHSLFYSVFFEDPLVWLALGVGSVAALARERAVPSPVRLPGRPKSASAAAAR